MRIGNRTYKVDYGHLVFLTIISGYVAWYLANTMSVSTHVNNILLVAPVAVFALVMALLIIPQCVQRVEQGEQNEEKPEQYDPLAPKLPTERRQVMRMLTLGAALGIFVFSLAFIGFDVAIFLFALAAMAICGERRPHHLIPFAAAIAVVMVYGFKALMPYPMPTFFL